MTKRKPARSKSARRSARPAFRLTSPDFRPGGPIGMEQVFNSFGCTGKNLSPMQLVHEEGGNAIITVGNPCPVIDPVTGRIWLGVAYDSLRPAPAHRYGP